MSHIYLYGSIGLDVDPADTSRYIQDLDTDEIIVHVASPGGDVFGGLTIMNALRSHKAKVTMIVESMALSAASFIVAGAGDRIIMRPGSEIMIHEAWQQAQGNASELIKSAENLTRVSRTIADIYARRTNRDVEEWLDIMATETWFSAEEAVQAGLADAVEDGKSPELASSITTSAMALMNSFDGRKKAPPSGLLTNHDGDEMTLLNDIANKLGVEASSATNEIVLAALDEVLNEQTVEVTKTVELVIDYPQDKTVVQGEKLELEPTVSDELPEGTTFKLTSDNENVVIDEKTGVATVTTTSEDEPGELNFEVEVALPEAETVSLEVKVVVEEAKEEETEEETSQAPEKEETPAENSSVEVVTLDKATYEELKEAAALGWEAKAKADKEKIVAEVDTWISEGRINASRRDQVIEQVIDSPVARNIYASIPAGTIPRSEKGYGKTTSENKTSEKKTNNLGSIFTAPKC